MMQDLSEHNDDDDDEEQVFATRKNGKYQLVVGDPEHDVGEPAPKWQRILHYNWFPDNAYEFRGIRVLDGVEAIRFIKLLSVTAVGIAFVHEFVHWMDWERDMNYTLSDLILYDANSILLDVMVFYVVGRLHRQRGVDHFAWTLIALVASIYTSWSTNFTFLQHSVSLYEMHCRWPWRLWLFLVILIPLITIVVVKHIQHAIQRQPQDLLVKLLELTFTILFFLVPQVSNPNFHFHHWYAGWLLGMHANYDTWWSRATMAWCWGQYVNGIAVYGRDPTLTCAYSYYLSVDGNCPYMHCYLQPRPPGADNSTTPQEYQPLPIPNWRNCSATGNYIP